MEAITVGRTVSAPAPVVNCETCVAIRLPATSSNPSTLTVITVDAGNGTIGTIVTTELPLLKVTLAGIGPALEESDNAPAVVVSALMPSLM